MMMRQVKVTSGPFHMTCWVENNDFLKKGIIIKLKDSPRQWTIDEVFDRVVEKDELHKDWKVGGLF